MSILYTILDKIIAYIVYYICLIFSQFCMYILRKADKILAELAKAAKVLIILGARQVGKTTLVKHFLSDQKVVFLNLDIELDKSRLKAVSSLSPFDAIKALGDPEYLVIDEAQREVEAGRIVKGWYDAEAPTKMILLGSSSLNLLNQTAESLTGRNSKLFLPPLLFGEIVAFQSWYSARYSKQDLYNNFQAPLDSLLIQQLVFGSYPESVITGDKEIFLQNLAADYLLKDVLQIGLVKTPETVKRLLLLLAHQIGAEVSINELAVNLGVSRQTIERYLELLEQTFVIFRLSAFSTNPRKEINKSQKIYFWDTGVRNALLKEFSTNPMRSDIGALWENWVITEFAKQNLLAGQKWNLYFWRSRSGSEIDLVTKRGEELRAYEIKWNKERRLRKTAFEDMYKTPVKLITAAAPLVEIE